MGIYSAYISCAHTGAHMVQLVCIRISRHDFIGEYAMKTCLRQALGQTSGSGEQIHEFKFLSHSNNCFGKKARTTHRLADCTHRIPVYPSSTCTAKIACMTLFQGTFRCKVTLFQGTFYRFRHFFKGLFGEKRIFSRDIRPLLAFSQQQRPMTQCPNQGEISGFGKAVTSRLGGQYGQRRSGRKKSAAGATAFGQDDKDDGREDKDDAQGKTES